MNDIQTPIKYAKSDITRKRMSEGIVKSLRENKNHLSDENINNIREALNENLLTQQDIAEKFKVNRETVSKIQHKLIVPIEEMTLEHKEYVDRVKKEKKESIISSNKRTGINKRSVSIDTIINILREIKNAGKLSYPKYTKLINESREVKVSQAQIKNWHSGKTKLYEEEFTEDMKNNGFTYQEYLTLLKEKKEVN